MSVSQGRGPGMGSVFPGRVFTPVWDHEREFGMLDVVKCERLAVRAVEEEFGSRARVLLGARLFRALVAEQLLAVAASQDESVSDASVRDMVERFFLAARAVV